LEEEGMLVFEDRKASRGRPTRYWSLTDKSHSRFPDRHDDLTSQLIESVKVVFGDSGLEQLISHREESSKQLYQGVLAHHSSVLDKLQALATLRSQEGYLATVEQENNHFWLLENHCPICAAASSCVNFCRSELQLFQYLFVGIATVSREEHIIQGARRCAYKVTPHCQD
jgi:predicted ArsR family transcriptional regulator